MSSKERHAHIINKDALPELYPTHLHDGQFWEALGRTVATFGLLEEALLKAVFAFTAQRECDPENIEEEFAAWVRELQKAMTDPLGGLIPRYRKAAKEYPEEMLEGFDDLLADLDSAKDLRNVLCHGSWRAPDEAGKSIPFFVNKKGEKFEELVDKDYLNTVQAHVVELICEVVNSVTVHGWQFPSSGGPGKPTFA